jgi:hypothetical protein
MTREQQDVREEGREVGLLAGLASSRWTLVVILFLALAVYASSLDDWFVADDFWFLRSAQAISFVEYSVDSMDFRETGALPEFDRYRPLYPLTWHAQYALFGLNAWGYHAVLLALHLGCIVLVWLIAHRLTKLTWASNLAALVFAIHPAYAMTVSWISGGNRLLATFPYLLCLLLFMKHMDGAGKRGACLAGSFLAFVVAVLLHHSALTMAAVLPAYAFLVAGTPREALRARSWFRFIPFAVFGVVLVGIHMWVREHLDLNQAFRFDWHQYMNYARFLGKSLFPAFVAPLPGASLLGEPWDGVLRVLEGLASVAMIVVTFVLVSQRRLGYLGAFVVCWFYVALLPDSTSVLGAHGRLLYMPGAALAILLVVFLLWAREALPPSAVSWTARGAPLLIIAVLLAASLLISRDIRDRGEVAAENQDFVHQLRGAVPSLEEDGVLYVVGAPANLVFRGTETRLDALVELYYGEVEVHPVPPGKVAEVGASLGEKDRIFHFVR